MGLSAVSGVFSRFFVVAFFLPAYVALIALWLTASSTFTPNLLEDHSEGTQLVILGGVAVVGGLVLSGLNYPLVRLFEGYPFMRLAGIPALRQLARLPIALQRRSYERLKAIYQDRNSEDADRKQAATSLDKSFPADPANLLPTRIGNAMRAYEQHSNRRWGLDGITVWPRIQLLGSPEERELHTDAETDLFVFLNASAASVAVGTCLIVDKAANGSSSPWVLFVIPFVVSYLLYRAAIGPAVRRGSLVRASIDMHRLEMYEQIGVRAPASLSDERALALRLNQFLLYGRPPLDDSLWRTSSGQGAAARTTNRGLIARFVQRTRSRSR